MNAYEEIRIQAYYDGELPPEDCAAVEALLASNPNAKAYLESLRATSDALKGLNAPSTEDAQWHSIEGKLDQPKGQILPFPAKIAGLAAALAIGAVAWFQWSNSGAHEQADEVYYAEVEIIETTYENDAPIVYVDEESGWTVVWVAEDDNEFEEPLI